MWCWGRGPRGEICSSLADFGKGSCSNSEVGLLHVRAPATRTPCSEPRACALHMVCSVATRWLPLGELGHSAQVLFLSLREFMSQDEARIRAEEA